MVNSDMDDVTREELQKRLIREISSVLDGTGLGVQSSGNTLEKPSAARSLPTARKQPQAAAHGPLFCPCRNADRPGLRTGRKLRSASATAGVSFFYQRSSGPDRKTLRYPPLKESGYFRPSLRGGRNCLLSSLVMTYFVHKKKSRSPFSGSLFLNRYLFVILSIG